MSNTRKTGKLEPQEWHLIKKIIADAMEQDSPPLRAALVESRCGDDARLLAEAELLLKQGEASLQEPTDSLEDCAEHATTTLWHDELQEAGRRIGAYRVLRRLARGGMGTVYLAARADGQFEKQVAIKVLKRGTDTEEVLRRFASERHIVARLDHPNIARLLDAGTTEDGLPYFVMEYVCGSPVTHFVREENLTVPERLNLFLKIASAVEFAHQNQVIHRDLKSSNILVNVKGEPKLLDFGIAKLVGGGRNSLDVTGAGEDRLTPNCASPEQLNGRPVTGATDVYALGVLLYEILSFEKPYKFSSGNPTRDEVRQTVCKQEPPPPSSVTRDNETARSLHGDLDAIVAYAMRKEPNLRYDSVADFAADVARHLSREPVRARQGTGWYRTRSLMIRHRKTFARLAGATLLLLLAGSSVLFWSRSEWAFKDASLYSTPSNSIAVLPFDSFGEGAPSYFVDGVHDNILTDLGKVSDLKVISRSGVAPYKGKPKNVKEIGRALGVTSVLEGSVQVSGNRVRINTQLIDTRTDAQIWADHYDRKTEDIFEVQSELAQTIVAQLKLTLNSEEKNAISKRPTNNLQAYELYMRARELFNGMPGLSPGPESEEARKLVQEAIQLDNTFTRAYCLLNSIDLTAYRFSNDHNPERLAAAKESADAALRIDPQSEEAQLALAFYYYSGLNDYRRTEEQLRTIRSSSAHTGWYYELSSLVERRLGKWRDSIRDCEKAIELNPQSAELFVNLVQTYNGLRRYEDSKRELDLASKRLNHPTPRLALVQSETAMFSGDLPGAHAALSQFPDVSTVEYQRERMMLALLEHDFGEVRRLASKADTEMKKTTSYWLIVAAVAQAEGNHDEEKSCYAQVKSLAQFGLKARSNDPNSLGEMAVAKAMLGEADEAVALARHAIELWPEQADALVAPMCQIRLVEVLATTGQRDAAFETLRDLIPRPFGLAQADLKLNPMWDFLRADPRFDEIIAACAQPIEIEK